MARVHLQGINKIYGNGFHAVHDVSLDIEDGEFMVLVGPSGCAKSTLLRIIAGLESASSGDLSIGEKRCNDVQPKDRGIAMVFQNYALYPHMTARQNLAFGLETSKKPRAEIEQRVNEAAELLEISELLDRKPGQMSGGQCQRVALGRAMVRKPEVFLFDEPLSNLDAKLRVSMRMRISRLHRQLKESGRPATMIYVTHDQVEAMTMGDRVCILNKGEIMQVDTPMSVYHRPKNKFVAEFIGSPSMNMLTGALAHSEGQLCINTLGQSFPLPAEQQATLANHAGKAVFLGLRPEHILIDNHEPKSGIKAYINGIEEMGSEAFVHFELKGHSIICKLISPEHTLRHGSEQTLSFRMDKCHVFDHETGVNLSLAQ